jgi:site-specific recombinase XerD
MSVRLLVHNSLPASASPYRLVDDCGREVTWVNQFLDAQKLRQLSLRSLRVYAYDLLHLASWFKNTRHSLVRLNQSLLLDYVRYQLEQQPSPTAQTINHRLCVVRCLYRFHYGQEIPVSGGSPARMICQRDDSKSLAAPRSLPRLPRAFPPPLHSICQFAQPLRENKQDK